MALAYAIKNLKGETFASSSNDALAELYKAYTTRFNHDNNLWANVMGAKAKIKDGGNPEMYGFNVGYDRAFDNTIVGGFFTYAKSKHKLDNAKNEANNFMLSAYMRTFIDSHEIDVKANIGMGKNDFKRNFEAKTYTGDYDSKFYGVEAEYGYLFDLENSMFVKPLVGLSYDYIKNDSFSEKGKALALNHDKIASKTLSAKTGVELRKYVDDGSYIYALTAVEREMYKSTDDMVVNFISLPKKIAFETDKRKHTYGVCFKLVQNLK